MRSLLPRWWPWFSRYSTFLRSVFTQLIIHPDAIPLTAFCTPNGLNEWLRMPQGAASVPACFVCVMLLVTAALDMIQMPLEDAIGSDDSPIKYVATLAAFLARLRPQKSELSPNKTRSEPRESNSWATSSLKMVSVLTMTVAALPRMTMHADIKQLRSLLDDLRYYLKPLPNTTRSIRPSTTLLKPQ